MYVTNDDARIGVRVDGENGDAVVLLPGLMFAHDVWDAQVRILAAKYRVIRPDLRGTGTSNAPEGPYLMENLAGDVAAVLDSLGVERAALVGHSLGGYVAIAFARMYVERLTGLALVCSRIDADAAEVSKIRYDLAARAEAERSAAPVAQWLAPRMLAPERYRDDSPEVGALARLLASADASGTAAMLRGMAVRDPGNDIAEDLDVPVLVVAGGRDQAVPIDAARATAAAFPNARIEILEGSGHVPMLEVPEQLGRILAGWLASLPSG